MLLERGCLPIAGGLEHNGPGRERSVMVKPESIKGIVEMSKGKGPAGSRPKPAPRIGPTAEQRAKGDFVRGGADTSHGQVNAIAYRRRPLFETMAKVTGSGIERDHLQAMRFYRDKHEEAAMSLTRCALDVQARSGGPPSCLPPILVASGTVKALEAAIGPLVDTMRAIVLEDQSFSDVAIARWGSRTQSWIETEQRRGRTKKGGKLAYVEKIVPKSGRHRERIKEEFLLGLRRLTQAHQLLTSTATLPKRAPLPVANAEQPTEAQELEPAGMAASVDPAYLDEAGRFRPWDEIAAIIRERVNDER